MLFVCFRTKTDDRKLLLKVESALIGCPVYFSRAEREWLHRTSDKLSYLTKSRVKNSV